MNEKRRLGEWFTITATTTTAKSESERAERKVVSTHVNRRE